MATPPRGKDGSRFLHIRCGAACANEFVIAATVVRVLGKPERSDERQQACAAVSQKAPDGMIHVVAWAVASDKASISAEMRAAWVGA